MLRSKFVALTLAAAFIAVPTFAADGAAVYKAKCAMCHGQDGKGKTSMGEKLGLRDLGSADVQKQTDEQLIGITANGKGKMPAYKGKLTDDEIKAVVAHIRTLR